MKVLFFLVCMLLILSPLAFAILDDFSDARDDGWTPVQGDWKVENGRYVQSNIDTVDALSMKTYHRSFMGDINWSDYTVEVDLRIDKPGLAAPIAGIFVRVTDKNADGNYYFFRIDTRPTCAPAAVESPNNNFKGEGGGKNEGATANEDGVEYHLKVVAAGNKFSFYIDNTLILERTDDVDPFMKGAVGLGTYNSGTSFDNFQVTGPGVISVLNRGEKLATNWGALKTF
jgi:hypothetical protein